MAKNYIIDIEYLEKLLDMLASYNNDNIVYRDYIRLRDYIIRLKSGFKGTPYSINLVQKLEEDYRNLQDLKSFYPYARSLAETKYGSNDFETTRLYKKLKFGTDESLGLMEVFFKEHGSFYYNAYKGFLEEIDGHFQYIAPNKNTDGEILFLRSVGEAFVSVVNYSNITKLSITAHEMVHVADAYNNPNFYENLLVREISSLFMEIIAIDYFAKKFNLNSDNYTRKAYLHSAIKQNALDIMMKSMLLKSYGAYRGKPQNEILVGLYREEYNKDEIEYHEKTSLVEDYFYIIAQLVAIELYFIYRENKKKALDILQDIVLNATDYNILDILKNHNIVLGKSLNRYENELIMGLKK